jgi:hypothetical protein
MCICTHVLIYVLKYMVLNMSPNDVVSIFYYNSSMDLQVSAFVLLKISHICNISNEKLQFITENKLARFPFKIMANCLQRRREH